MLDPGEGSEEFMGKRAAAGSLEHSVLEALWDGAGWLTPAQVHERLGTAWPIGYTTVTTVLVRLCRKGRIERRKMGRAFAYRAMETREQFAAGRMDEILDAAGDRRSALAHFAAYLSAEERAELRKRLGGRSQS
jgi:predicted transcriptional regulator